MYALKGAMSLESDFRRNAMGKQPAENPAWDPEHLSMRTTPEESKETMMCIKPFSNIASRIPSSREQCVCIKVLSTGLLSR